MAVFVSRNESSDRLLAPIEMDVSVGTVPGVQHQFRQQPPAHFPPQPSQGLAKSPSTSLAPRHTI